MKIVYPGSRSKPTTLELQIIKPYNYLKIEEDKFIVYSNYLFAHSDVTCIKCEGDDFLSHSSM